MLDDAAKLAGGREGEGAWRGQGQLSAAARGRFGRGGKGGPLRRAALRGTRGLAQRAGSVAGQEPAFGIALPICVTHAEGSAIKHRPCRKERADDLGFD